jgi:hypothetical protein
MLSLITLLFVLILLSVKLTTANLLLLFNGSSSSILSTIFPQNILDVKLGLLQDVDFKCIQSDLSSTTYAAFDPASNISSASLSVKSTGNNCIDISWTSSKANSDFLIEDCISFGTNREWIAGQETFTSFLFTNTSQGTRYAMQPFVASDIYSEHKKLGGVLQAQWLSSDGWIVKINPNTFDTPLWSSFRADDTQPSLCLRSEWSGLYGPPLNRITKLEYHVCKYANIADTWVEQVQSKINFMNNHPARNMTRHPVWSTWATFKKDINETAVLIFADAIVSSSYPFSVLEIDDKWSTKYGDLMFDPIKFPTPLIMVAVTILFSPKL